MAMVALLVEVALQMAPLTKQLENGANMGVYIWKHTPGTS